MLISDFIECFLQLLRIIFDELHEFLALSITFLFAIFNRVSSLWASARPLSIQLVSQAVTNPRQNIAQAQRLTRTVGDDVVTSIDDDKNSTGACRGILGELPPFALCDMLLPILVGFDQAWNCDFINLCCSLFVIFH